jgi:hypothetical protein
MSLTLRQLFAYDEIVAKINRLERAEELALTSLAIGMQSDKHKQAVEKTIKELRG